MSYKSCSVVDFETEAISKRPDYPPKPVGVAIRSVNGDRKYYAFGHPTKNNSTVGEARAALKEAYRAKRVVFHHSAFDVDVAHCHMDVTRPTRVEDTLFLAFLKDPTAVSLDLKTLGEKDAGIKPNAQAKMNDWIMAHVKGATIKKVGEHISKAPGDIVGRYAIGDIDTTYALYKKYRPEIYDRGMLPAYERELACMNITSEMERSGVRVHRRRLKECRGKFEQMDELLLRRIAKRLKISSKELKSDDNKKGFNLNSGDQLGERLKRLGKLDHIIKTPSGKISTSIDNLQTMCKDKALINMLAMHSVLQKSLGTFIKPWLAQSALTDGRVLPKFNQVRGYNEGGGGTRSGRFSSADPNMQQISANVLDSKNKDILLLIQKMLKEDFDYRWVGMRDFFIPDEGCIMLCTDYNQQELRLLAHFENDMLRKMYMKNPLLDVHEYCRQLLIKQTGIDLPRKAVKTIVFGLIYGMGIGKMADDMGIHKNLAKKAKEGILRGIPGIKTLITQLHGLADREEPLITLGGRQYFCEEPKFIGGRMVSFEYKMLNYLIQPSAADYTKQGMINVREEVPEVRIAIQVHDELITMAPNLKYAKRIEQAMCREKLRVPMIAETKSSNFSWARAA